MLFGASVEPGGRITFFFALVGSEGQIVFCCVGVSWRADCFSMCSWCLAIRLIFDASVGPVGQIDFWCVGGAFRAD